MRLLYVCSLMVLVLVAACSPAASGADITDLPPGDAERGARLFTEAVDGAPPCSTCHTLDGTAQTGPSLDDYATVAGERVEGQSAEEYTHTSIIRPAAHVVPGHSNSMFNQYGRHLTPQQIADLIAYLLTL